MKKKNIPPLPKKEEKKNARRIAEIVLAALIIFWSVCSVLGVIGFARSCDDDNNSLNVVNASADEVSSNSLDIPHTYELAITSQWDGLAYPAGNANLRYGCNLPTFYYDVRYGRFTGYKPVGYNFIDITTDMTEFPFGVTTLDSSGNFNLYAGFVYSPINQVITANYITYVGEIYTLETVSTGRDLVIDYYIYFNDDTFDVERIRINGVNVAGNMSNCNFAGYNRSYYPFGDNIRPLLYTYYMPLSYDNGYYTGFSSGETQGYDNGYIAGNNAGYNRGYNAGVADSNNYSFNGLITSVIDVPIKAFTGLFNFEILGVNLSGFFFALLTVCVVLTVAKLFI